jgi:hypothetical protein
MPQLYNDNVGEVLRKYSADTSVTVGPSESNVSATGVQQIVAGYNITLDPADGQGIVTVNAEGLLNPWIHFDVTQNANGLQFSNSAVNVYLYGYQLNVFRNGILIDPAKIVLANSSTIQVNECLFAGDTVDILNQALGQTAIMSLSNTNVDLGSMNSINFVGAQVSLANGLGQVFINNYSNANVSAYLPLYTGTLSNSADIITLTANSAAQGVEINALESNVTILLANAATQSNAIANLQALQYSNANAAAYMPVYGGNILISNITATSGNFTSSVTAGSVRTDSLLYANGSPWQFGNGNVNVSAGVTQIVAGTDISINPANGLGVVTVNATYGNANVAAYLANYSGNVSGGYYLGNITQATGYYSNANVANFLQVLSSNVTTSANVTGSYIFGNGSQLTGITVNYSNANVQNYLPTYSGNILNLGITANLAIGPATERVNIVAQAPAVSQNIDVLTSTVWFFTTNANTNQTINLRGNSTTSLDSYLGTGQSLTLAYIIRNGATGYYPTSVLIDGASQAVSWSGNAPTSGSVSATDSYVFTVIKTGAAVFTTLASKTRYG